MSLITDNKKILDMTCGSRTIWFNKHHPAAVYCDKRKENYALHFGKAHTSLHQMIVDPDVICDFTDLPFEDESFNLVVFDPPHLTTAKETPGFIKAMWCGDSACEDQLKDETGGVKSRCIPFEEEHLSDVCVCCGKPAKHMIYWGIAY